MIFLAKIPHIQLQKVNKCLWYKKKRDTLEKQYLVVLCNLFFITKRRIKMDQKEKMELVETIKKAVQEAVREEFAKMAAGGFGTLTPPKGTNPNYNRSA
jgi:hypothetical protein